MNGEGENRRLAPPTQHKTPPMDVRGAMPPMNARGAAPPMNARGAAPPMDARGAAPPMDARGAAPPMDARGAAGKAATGEAKRHAVIHRMTRRCFGWDYRQRAIYQITLVQRERREPLLGRLEVSDGHGGWVAASAAKALGLAPEQIEARVALTPLGEAILAHWKRIGDFTPEIKPLFCQIMPDHLHAILEVTRPMAKPLGNAIGGFKTGCEKIYRKLALSEQHKKLALSEQHKKLALSEQHKKLALSASGEGPILSASGEGPALSASGEGPALSASGEELGRLWEEGFQDSILFRDGQLNNMFNYLRDNPRRLAVKRLFPGLFRVVGELRVKLRLAPQTQYKEPQASLKSPQVYADLLPGFAEERPRPGELLLGLAEEMPRQGELLPGLAEERPRQGELLPGLAEERPRPGELLLGLAEERPRLGEAPCAMLAARAASFPAARAASFPAARAASFPAARAVGTFFALGNRFLLDGPLLQVQVSRRDFRYRRIPKPGGGLKIVRDEKGVPQIEFASAAFETRCARLLTAAKHGMTLISPCVSDGEREIARRALEARFKLVTLANKGFSKLQKPSGRYFDACADGRLLMLAPVSWPYVPGEKPMRREDALVLNRLAQALAGDGAAEINYRGVTFDHIDESALRAVRGTYVPSARP